MRPEVYIPFMKIIVHAPLLVGTRFYRPGDLAEAPDARANYFIATGRASPYVPVETTVETAAFEPEKEMAVINPPKPKKKPPRKKKTTEA